MSDASINRSLYAYLANPAEERSRYDSEVDTVMTLLRFRRASDARAMGILTWFAVHPTSMYQNNTLVAGDNKGTASWLMERELADDDSIVPRDAEDGGGFVAAFAQSNHGDTTPNVLGAWCDDGSGEECGFEDSTCGDGRAQSCRGRGPEFRQLDRGVSSAFEVGRRQYVGAREIYVSVNCRPLVHLTSPMYRPSTHSCSVFPFPIFPLSGCRLGVRKEI